MSSTSLSRNRQVLKKVAQEMSNCQLRAHNLPVFHHHHHHHIHDNSKIDNPRNHHLDNHHHHGHHQAHLDLEKRYGSCVEPAPTAPLLANRSFVSLRSLDLDVLRGDIKSENSNLTTCLSLPYRLSTMLRVSGWNRERELKTKMAQIVRLLPYD